MITEKPQSFFLSLFFLLSFSSGILAQTVTNTEKLLATNDSIFSNFSKTPNKINTPASEFPPLLNATETILVFNRENVVRRKKTNQIFVMQKVMGRWGQIQDITSPFDNVKNVQAVFLSPDGNTMLLSGGKEQSDLYLSRFVQGRWEKPQLFPTQINSEFEEKEACLSYDERFLFFSSNRKTGLGGYDLYMCTKQDNGDWSEALNLGKKINSIRDERAPNLHTDGETLYFSSNRRGGKGGLDVYYSTLIEKHWNDAKNIGNQVNTRYDDNYFSMSISKKNAWWSSFSPRNKYNINCLNLTHKKQLPKQVVYTGLVYMEDLQPTDDVEITISDAETKELVGEYRPNPITGYYIYILEPEKNYNVLLTAPGYLGYTHDFFVPTDSSFQVIQRSIELEPIKFYSPPGKVTEGEQFITVKDILFGVNDVHNLKFNKNLNKLAQHLIEHRSCIIEIGGHSDESGKLNVNLDLAYKRAQNIANYLLNKGVFKSSFVIRNYGPNVPIAKNDSYEALRFNRRVEFRILKQGRVKLNIQRIVVPEQYRAKQNR